MRILQASPVVYSANPAISNAIIRNNLNITTSTETINQQNHNQTLINQNNDYENLNGNTDNAIITNFITTTETFDNISNNLTQDIYNNKNIVKHNSTTKQHTGIQDNNCFIKNSQNQINVINENYHENLYNNLNQLNNIKSNNKDDNNTDNFPTTTDPLKGNFNRNLNCCDIGENINNGNDNDNCRQLLQENLNILDTKQDNLNRHNPLYQSTEISKNLNIRHANQFNNFNLEETEEDFCYSDSEEIEDKDDNDVEFTESPPLQEENLKNIEICNEINENFENTDEILNIKLENIKKFSEDKRQNDDIIESFGNITCDAEKNIKLESSGVFNDKIINSEVIETDLTDCNSIQTNRNFDLEQFECQTTQKIVTAEETETKRDNIEIEIKENGFILNNMVKETLSSSPISTDINNEGILSNKRPRRQRCSSPAGCVLKLTNKNRNPDDSLMDDEGGYSTSSPSTFGSLNSSPDLSNNYPRGIINPNYPGFQHLAHTLSEHFVTHPNDPDDSDLSEFEIELSIDDEEKFESLNNNNNNNNNNKSDNSTSYHSSSSNFNNKNSNNIINNNSNSSDIMLSSISDELNYNLETSIRSLKEPREHKEILLPEIRVSFECHGLKNEKRFELKDKSLSQSFEKTGITDISPTDAPNLIEKPAKNQQTILKKKICTDDIDDDDISSSCDLETYLQKYETSADIRSAKITKSLLIQNDSQNEYVDETNRNCPTPDILQKSNKNDFSHRQRTINPIESSILPTTLVGSSSSATTVTGSENRPDLLRNVCPQTDAIMLKENQLQIDEESENLNHNNNNNDDDVIDGDFADAKNPTDDIVNDFVEQKQLRNQVPDNIRIDCTISNNDTNKDDISFGITPVDIVGDFGREVEREFGLLVTGYNTRLCRDPSPVFVEHEKKFMEKMTDAILSDAKEQITFSSTPSINNSSIAANIFIARATLNQPITASSSIPCDLVMQTSATNNIIQNKNVEQNPNKEFDKTTIKMTQNSNNNNNEYFLQPTKFLVKQVKQRIPPPPPPRRFLAQQLLQQKEQQLLKHQQQQQHMLNSTLATSTTTNNNSNTQSLNVVMQQNDTVSINTDMTNTTNNISNEKLNTKNSINSNISQPTNNSDLPTTNNSVANSDHNNIVATTTIVPVLESTTNTINSKNNCDNNKQNLPTAIVKPKYQKYSYDERQLPPIGLVGFCDRKANRSFWKNINDIDNDDDDSYSDENKQITYIGNHINKHNKSRKKSSILSNQNTNSIGDRVVDHTQKLTKKSFSSRNSSQNLSGRDQYRKHYHNSGHNRDNNITAATTSSSSVGLNSNYVAVVTPRKKDKFESILMSSSDLKKMNQIYENHSNNNNNNIKNSVGTNNYNGGNNIGKYSNNNGTSASSVRMKSKRETSSTASASFDVYNIETALPVIDLDAIENHLKKAKEEEKKRRNDREEIRRRLAMGAEDDYFNKIVNADRPGRKPSLQSRLQNGMNLQICFMNDASSDTESPSSDSETCPKLSKSISTSSNMTSASSSRYSSNASIVAHPYNSRPLSVSVSSSNNINNNNNNCLNKRSLSQRPSTLLLGPPIPELGDDNESDFFTKQARLQIEARMALAQAKDMAHMQMEIERQKQKQSPITEVIRNSLEKVGVPFPPEKRRVSRQMCTDMNIAQLQIIVNELHTQIERLNEKLVQYLMERDELHMGQDSMLVDIEDLTRYLGAKEQTLMNENSSKNSPTSNQISTNNINSVANNSMATGNIGTPQMQSKFQRIASLVKK